MSSRRVAVCQIDELKNGQMRQMKANGKDILLARHQDEYFAVAPHCSHYGAPLEKGVMSDGRIICPWHNACYRLQTGEHLEPPGRDRLASYAVSIEGNSVFVEVPTSEVTLRGSVVVDQPRDLPEHQVPPLAQYDPQVDDRTFVIVGGGAAGSAAAEMLRQQGFQGRLVMLTADQDLPYDRTALSKKYLQKDAVDDPDLLRSPDFYETYGIEIKTSAKVTQIDSQAQTLTYGDGQTLKYDAVLLAPGGKVRQLPVEGMELENVFTLRRASDAAQILDAAQDAQRAVVVGTGFIGMEVASSLKQQGLDVTVIASSNVPFSKVLGEDIGKLFQQVHESEGVQFKFGAKAKAFSGNGHVQAVMLDTGETVSADIVVVGIGVDPNTDFVEPDLLAEGDRSIVVNEFLQAAPNLYAAGDSAQFPYAKTGEPIRVEHWRVALQQGRTAAINMAGDSTPFTAVPFFWTGQFGLKLRYVGHAEDWDEVIIQGSLDEKTFLAFYVQGEQVMAVAGMGRDRDIAAISELMRLDEMPAASDIRKHDRDWAKVLAERNAELVTP